MKVKIKDEITDIRLKLTHQELVLINEALLEYKNNSKPIDMINPLLFDCQEFESEESINKKIWSMCVKTTKKLSKINTY
jgi:hypothetical protein